MLLGIVDIFICDGLFFLVVVIVESVVIGVVGVIA
jgi:hypothetical protein